MGLLFPRTPPRINEYDEDITFSVTFGDSRKDSSAVAMIPKFFNNEG